jgi:Tfp pilus assembly protein PilF
MGEVRRGSRAAGKGADAASRRCARALLSRLVSAAQRNSEAETPTLRRWWRSILNQRDARRELGISYYQQHRPDEAMEQFKALQAIDPDDLAAHYNLAILYRRKGLKKQAEQEAALYTIKRIDPGRADLLARLSAQAS